MARTGRPPGPTKLTPRLVDDLCELLACGHYIEDACYMVDIHPTTVRDWLKVGEQYFERYEQNILSEFFLAYKKALALAKNAHLVRIAKGKRGWQSSAWVMERRWPKQWANPVGRALAKNEIQGVRAMKELRSIIDGKLEAAGYDPKNDPDVVGNDAGEPSAG